jgi:isocitrate dehydrogenase
MPSTQPQKILPIAFAHGDGIGPEMMPHVIDIIRAALAKEDVALKVHKILMGKEAVATYGDELPDETLDEIRNFNPNPDQPILALKGPLETGFGGGKESANVRGRKNLNLYACLRPCYSPDGSIKILQVRENMGTVYSGHMRQLTANSSVQSWTISKSDFERIAHIACQLAANAGLPLLVVEKSNIIKGEIDLTSYCKQIVEQSYPHLRVDRRTADMALADLVGSTGPGEAKGGHHRVVVADNLISDLYSDVSAARAARVLQVKRAPATIALAPSLNVGTDPVTGRLVIMGEQTGGTAPDIAGQDKANPSALVLAAAEMLRYAGHPKAADLIDNAVRRTWEMCRTADLRKIGLPVLGTKGFAATILGNLGANPRRFETIATEDWKPLNIPEISCKKAQWETNIGWGFIIAAQEMTERVNIIKTVHRLAEKHGFALAVASDDLDVALWTPKKGDPDDSNIPVKGRASDLIRAYLVDREATPSSLLNKKLRLEQELANSGLDILESSQLKIINGKINRGPTASRSIKDALPALYAAKLAPSG